MTTAQTLADVAAAYLINAKARADLQASSEQSRQAALHDALTGLPNRVLMLELLEQAFRRGRRSGRAPAVFFLDLDRIQGGQRHLWSPSRRRSCWWRSRERLSGVLAPGDSLARVAGDEFVVLCEDLE